MPVTTALDIAFAAGIGIAALALTGAAFRFLHLFVLNALFALASGGAIAAWVIYALRHHRPRELAIAAGGITACALATTAAVLLRRALVHAEDADAYLAATKVKLRNLIDAEAEERAAELERTLARARADSVSLLVEEERRIAEERRTEFAERERATADALMKALTETQAQVEQRLSDWNQDLDRAAEGMRERISDLAQHQKTLVADAEARVTADAERLAADSEEHRAALSRLRAELDKAMEETLAAARTEVESHAAERRRGLHELDERMRRRERELMEQIEREEGESVQRIRAGFEDVQRRQIETMQRIVERAASTYSDEATQQFANLVKTSREDAAQRLARELERSVESFAREAESVLAERLAHVGDAGAQRLERRLADAAKSLQRQHDEWMSGLDGRISELEADVRRRLEELGADADAERAVIEARLQELLRRAESAV
ncbi:MAG TPA: hypothetical protein VKP14_06575 [Gaiellaceae bacterium]|nr:hypothetical protein [Gaiellaceae bacterium]